MLSPLNTKWPPSHYMNFDPRKGQHMHDLCQRSTCQFRVCLLSFFHHFFLFSLFFKIFFVMSDFNPACVFVCYDADDVCDGVSV